MSTVKDSFNRADSTTTMGNADTGQTWVEVAGNWGISSNKAYSTETGSPYNFTSCIESATANVLLTATWTGAGKYAGLSFRVADNSNRWIFAAESTSYKVLKYVSGTPTAMYNSGTPVSGDVLSVLLSGNNITCKQNGNTLYSASDAANNANTSHGFYSTLPTGMRWEDYSAYGPPTATSLDVTTGGAGGGTTVVITGTFLTDATGVTFGGNAATSVVVNSDTQITCVTPAHAVGTVDVVVTCPYGTGTKVNGFSYVAPPDLTSISPISGAVAGGTTVTCTGTNLTGTTNVQFGADEATDVTVVNATTVTCVTPAHAQGLVNVKLINTVGDDTLTNAYTYGVNISSVTPAVCDEGGGITVDILGGGFTGATAVKFGTTNATSFTVVSGGEITAVVPAHAAGATTVKVEVGADNDTETFTFTKSVSPTPPASTVKFIGLPRPLPMKYDPQEIDEILASLILEINRNV